MNVSVARFRAMESVEAIELSSTEAAVLLYLAHRIDANLSCWPSRERIAAGTKFSVRSVSRALSALRRRELVEITYRRDSGGRTRYQDIRLSFPKHLLSAPGAFVARGPNDTEGKNIEEPGDTLAYRNIQFIDKQSEELKEDVKTTQTDSVDLISRSGEENKDLFSGKNDPSLSVEIDNIANSYALEAGVATLPFPHHSNFTLAHESRYDQKLLEGCALVSSFLEACAKGSPKARVAFWHELGRLQYPQLPRYRERHKIPYLQSKELHAVFNALGRIACPVLASLFANWEWAVGHVNVAEDPPRVPEIPYIWERLRDFQNFWASLFSEAVFESSAEKREVIEVLGIR